MKRRQHHINTKSRKYISEQFKWGKDSLMENKKRYPFFKSAAALFCVSNVFLQIALRVNTQEVNRKFKIFQNGCKQ